MVAVIFDGKLKYTHLGIVTRPLTWTRFSAEMLTTLTAFFDSSVPFHCGVQDAPLKCLLTVPTPYLDWDLLSYDTVYSGTYAFPDL
jgi:hypothetical protein